MPEVTTSWAGDVPTVQANIERSDSRSKSLCRHWEFSRGTALVANAEFSRQSLVDSHERTCS